MEPTFWDNLLGHSFKDSFKLEGGTVDPKRRFSINLGCTTSQNCVDLIRAPRRKPEIRPLHVFLQVIKDPPGLKKFLCIIRKHKTFFLTLMFPLKSLLFKNDIYELSFTAEFQETNFKFF